MKEILNPLMLVLIVVLTTIVNLLNDTRMSSNTMSFALPQALRDYIDARVRSGEYGNTSEYLRDLIRRDQEDQARKRLSALIEEGLQSGPGRAVTKRVRAELKARALSAKR